MANGSSRQEGQDAMSELLVERLHQFFVRVFTTYDLFDEDKRREMHIESFALDDEVAQLEVENERQRKLLSIGGAMEWAEMDAFIMGKDRDETE